MRDEKSHIPIRVLFGWLPGVSAKEAKNYVQGAADRHCEAAGISGYAIFPFDGGFAYEIHEGGNCRAYLPRILKHFQQAREAELPLPEVERVVIATQTRGMQMELLGQGFVALRLPESATVEQTDWLEAGSALTPLAPVRRGVLIAGIGLLVTGLIVGVGGVFARHQPYKAPAVPQVKYSPKQLPHAQWERLARIRPNHYAEKLQFREGRWETVEKPLAPVAPVLPSIASPSAAATQAPALPVPPGFAAPEVAPMRATASASASKAQGARRP